MEACAFCGEPIAGGTESDVKVSRAAEREIREEMDFRLDDRHMHVCTKCIVQMVEDYIFTSQ